MKTTSEELTELRAIVAKLPKTADGVPCVPYADTAVVRSDGQWRIMLVRMDGGVAVCGRTRLECCYSSIRAAKTAMAIRSAHQKDASPPN